jgi:hypothetical protein
MANRRFLAALLCCLASAAFSADVGVLLNQVPQIENTGDDTVVSWTGTLLPWFSVPLGERSNLYLSGGLNAVYREAEGWDFIPELYRFEALFHGPSHIEWTFGRSQMEDATGYIANGLFDGVSVSMNLGSGSFRAGAWYTGFLYKKNAYIIMTGREQADYNDPVDWDDPASYFASARALVDLGWETGGFSLGLLGQFDLRSDEKRAGEPRYHSQYFSLAYTFSPTDELDLEAGGAVELIEAEKTAAALSAFFSLDWMFPGSAADRLSFGLRWASGKWGDVLAAFNPVTTETQGRVLKAKLSGLMVFEGSYRIRLARPLSAEVSALYFIRTDGETFPAASGSSYLLGPELDGRLVWVPVSDLSFILGGGAFFPQPGGAYDISGLQWQVSLGVMISLY